MLASHISQQLRCCLLHPGLDAAALDERNRSWRRCLGNGLAALGALAHHAAQQARPNTRELAERRGPHRNGGACLAASRPLHPEAGQTGQGWAERGREGLSASKQRAAIQDERLQSGSCWRVRWRRCSRQVAAAAHEAD